MQYFPYFWLFSPSICIGLTSRCISIIEGATSLRERTIYQLYWFPMPVAINFMISRPRTSVISLWRFDAKCKSKIPPCSLGIMLLPVRTRAIEYVTEYHRYISSALCSGQRIFPQLHDLNPYGPTMTLMRPSNIADYMKFTFSITCLSTHFPLFAWKWCRKSYVKMK